MTQNQAEVDKRSKPPKGHFVVYVGSEMRRFVIPTSFLKSPMFQQLLDKAAEEYGFNTHNNRLLLPCDESTFQSLTDYLAKHCS
ncbi:Detected protein of confused Function [Hibiscus syriacus]|uniref:Detected protein of confused Function n=1 Tax=Hibiscus syriacus TaxID=106335 RepID=A0A6A2YYR1_HIBSY|nr:Detected protein of confused Function [Hibiscus syriacus]